MGSRERFPAVTRADHIGTGSSWCACPGSFPERDLCHPSVPVPTRDRVPAIPLLRYRTQTGSSPSLCPGTGLDGVPALRLSWYWSGTGSPVSLCSGTGWDELCPCSHHPRITPVLHQPIFPAAPPPTPPELTLSLPPVATTPGVPRVPRSAPSRLQGFPGEPLIHGLRGSLGFVQSRAVASIPGMPLPGEFVAAGSRTTPRKCSLKRDPKVHVSRCHSSPTHPRARKQRWVIQIIIPEGKLRHGNRLGSLEAESQYVPRQKVWFGAHHAAGFHRIPNPLVDTGELSRGQQHDLRGRNVPGFCRSTSPCCVFLASCEKTNKCRQELSQRGPAEFTLTHRESSFHIFWERSKVSVAGGKSPVALSWLFLAPRYHLWSQIPRSACISQFISSIPSRHALVTLRMFSTKISFPWMGFFRNGSPQLLCTTSMDIELGGSIQDPPVGLTCLAVLAIEGFPCRAQWLQLSVLETPPNTPNFSPPAEHPFWELLSWEAWGSLCPPSPHSWRA